MMATEALLRPQSAGAAILQDAGSIGTGQSGSTVKVFMKVASARFGLSVGVLDTTGDGDALTHIDHNNELRGQIQLSGFVLADHDIGIEELTPAVGVAANNPVSVQFKAANAKIYKFKMVIKDIVIDWNRQSPVVGLSIVGLLTDNLTTDIAFQEAAS